MFWPSLRSNVLSNFNTMSLLPMYVYVTPSNVPASFTCCPECFAWTPGTMWRSVHLCYQQLLLFMLCFNCTMRVVYCLLLDLLLRRRLTFLFVPLPLTLPASPTLCMLLSFLCCVVSSSPSLSRSLFPFLDTILHFCPSVSIPSSAHSASISVSARVKVEQHALTDSWKSNEILLVGASLRSPWTESSTGINLLLFQPGWIRCLDGWTQPVHINLGMAINLSASLRCKWCLWSCRQDSCLSVRERFKAGWFRRASSACVAAPSTMLDEGAKGFSIVKS